ncbi:MAG: hypothetical protein LUH10_00120 [Tannerellaceae bacterium]|nr:hypothetical protein [Tannerellaceae bacterium]
MDKGSRIKDLVQGIAGTNRKRYPFRLMEVVSVEGDLCRAKMESFEIPGIRLSPIINGSENGVLITPSEGSIILVADISNGELRDLVAIAYTEIDSIRVHKGDTTIYADNQSVSVEVGESRIDVTDGLIEMNGGENKGLVKIDELTEKLNDLTDTVNELINSYNGHTHETTATLGLNGPAEIFSILPDDQIDEANEFTSSDYENPKITH